MSEQIDHVLLVGAGVVGRAIAIDHLRHNVPVWIADQDEHVLSQSCDRILCSSDGIADSAAPWGARIPIPTVRIRPRGENHNQLVVGSGTPRWLVIESIAERLEIKQTFFGQAEGWFALAPILTTNTSTLSITAIADTLSRPERLCGMHFFMPVSDRHAAEIVLHPKCDASVVESCCAHVRGLAKCPLQVLDGPGFVVNRILSPYLNLAMWLVCGGISAKLIRSAALLLGMPMSPLELIDLIGARTAWDGGKTVWQAFPKRMDPSPLLPGLIKQKKLGIAWGEGFYAYDVAGTKLADNLTEHALRLIRQYHHDDFNDATIDSGDEMLILVRDFFAATITLEIAAIERDGIADRQTIEAAMRGGLAWCRPTERQRSPTKASVLQTENLLSVSDQRCKQLANEYPQIKSIQAID